MYTRNENPIGDHVTPFLEVLMGFPVILYGGMMLFASLGIPQLLGLAIFFGGAKLCDDAGIKVRRLIRKGLSPVVW